MSSQSDMREERTDELLLVRYLLGRLTEEEQVRVEDRAFTDAVYCSALEAAEADLIDAYVRGELPPGDRLSFERRFLASPERRNKIAFARSLAQVTGELNPRERRSPAKGLAFLDVVRSWSAGLQFAAGLAALVCVAGATWLVFEDVSMRSQVAALEARRRDLEGRQAELRRQLGSEQERNRALATQSQPRQGSGINAVVASLVFLPGLSRAETSRSQLLLDSAAQIARLEIQLEERDNFQRFRAELRSRGGEEVLTRGNLSRHRAGAGYVVSLDVPASALPAGDYELTLKGVSGESSQDIGFYYFKVQKR